MIQEPPPDTRTIQQFTDDLASVAADMVPFLTMKRMAYGTTALTRFGPIGIVIRMSDKLDRVTNRIKDGQDTVGDDSVEDSWRDLVGYALLGLMEHQRAVRTANTEETDSE